MILSSYSNTSGSLEEREMLWEHEPQVSVSIAFASSPKLSRVFLKLNRNTENMYSISFRKHRDEKKNENFNSLNSRDVTCARVATHVIFIARWRRDDFRITITSKVGFNI